MPKHKFQLSIDHWTEIRELPGSWPITRLKAVLDILEYDDPISDDEVIEITQMLLEDLGPRRAAEVVLEVVFGNQMSPGVRQNIADDLQEVEPWAQHATVSQQSGIFTTLVLLQRAMPRFFGEPEAVQFQLQIHTAAPEAQGWLTESVNPGLVIRLLAQGMDPEATLNRLYEDEIKGDWFPNARDILWCVSKIDADHYSIISSLHWMAPLEDRSNWAATASIDRVAR